MCRGLDPKSYLDRSGCGLCRTTNKPRTPRVSTMKAAQQAMDFAKLVMDSSCATELLICVHIVHSLKIVSTSH